MVLYRRSFLTGGTFFFTVTLRDRRTNTLVDDIHPLRALYADQIRLASETGAGLLTVCPAHSVRETLGGVRTARAGSA